tara:strand:- start:22069 stop:22923 length:855 start_codon:yes stop_codon:yes gene_type:complete
MKKTKGIILAGGKGTRLFPATKVTCKQLLPVYDKPMIYYPLSILILMGITEILIICNKEDEKDFIKLLGDGSDLGISIEYKIQAEPKGIPQAFEIGEEFIGKSNVCLILGDNMLYGDRLTQHIKQQSKCTVFAYPVKDPENFGVVSLNKNGSVKSIEEKPKSSKSNLALIGLYFFDHTVCKRVKNLKPSKRGETEIIDLIKSYGDDIHVEQMGRGVAWLDTGTPEAWLKCSQFVETIEARQGLKIGCIEEMALSKKMINKAQLQLLINSLETNNSYKEYLQQLI